jgi:hypothetical protein
MLRFIPSSPWPNSFDLVVTCLFLAIVVIVPAVGYVFMVLDFRAYLRSLGRGLILMVRSIYEIPEWARRETPPAIAALGLRLPCSQEDLNRAYRKRVKRLHPDHGGDQRRFLQLQAHFEEATSILASLESGDFSSWSTSAQRG